MGREVRRVPADWEHPTQDCPHINHGDPCYRPLFDESFAEAFGEWQRGLEDWTSGSQEQREVDDRHGDYPPTAAAYIRWVGIAPDPDDYRPHWEDEERTHYQLYETVSEGTPVSPVFATPREVAEWYATHGDPVYGAVSLESALAFVELEWAPSFVIGPGGVESGVAFVGRESQ